MYLSQIDPHCFLNLPAKQPDIEVVQQPAEKSAFIVDRLDFWRVNVAPHRGYFSFPCEGLMIMTETVIAFAKELWGQGLDPSYVWIHASNGYLVGTFIPGEE